MSEVIITQKLTSKKYDSSICCLSFIILVFYLSFVVLPNVMDPGIAVLTSSLFIVLLGGTSIFFLFYLLWRYRGTGKLRTFSISDESIKIMVPKKHNFQINWSNFDTIQMYKHISRLQGLSNYKFYRINFLLNNIVIQNVDIEYSIDFSAGKCKQIRSLLNQYAVRMNKEYFWGKRRKKK